MDADNRKDSLSEVIFDGMAMPPFRPLRLHAKKRFEDIRNLDTHAEDVIISSYPKSGSHWVWEIVGMLLRGEATYVKEGKESMFLEALDDLDTIHSMTSPRPLNTHVPFRWLPRRHVENGWRIVHVVRNPKDVAVSMFYHFKGSGEFVNSESVQFDDCINRMLSTAPNQPYGGWFTFEKDFMEHSGVDIYFVLFENLKRHPKAEIKRMADYLKISCSDQLLDDIAEKCSFTRLKEADDTIKDKTLYKEIVLGANPVYQGDITKVNPKSFFREGKIGNWKGHFTVSQCERFDAFYSAQMHNCGIKMVFE
ncbi:sulfotransferase 1B1-like [Crassostrea virginica]